jgi:hypothetical protein
MELPSPEQLWERQAWVGLECGAHVWPKFVKTIVQSSHPNARKKMSRKHKLPALRSIAHYLSFVVPPILVVYFLGGNLNIWRYAIYCVYALPLPVIRSFVLGQLSASMWTWVFICLYSLGWGIMLLWAIVGL